MRNFVNMNPVLSEIRSEKGLFGRKVVLYKCEGFYNGAKYIVETKFVFSCLYFFRSIEDANEIFDCLLKQFLLIQEHKKRLIKTRFRKSQMIIH